MFRGEGVGENNQSLPTAAAPPETQRPQAAALLLVLWSVADDWSNIGTVINHNALI